MELLKVCGVRKRYPGAERDAVGTCGFTLSGGECIFIQGVSGSGKSTLLLMLGGLLTPTDGRILWGGRELYAMGDRELSAWRGKEAGYLFQNSQLAQALTVRENLLLARHLGSNPKADVDAMLRELELTEEARRLPGQLSGGQRRRAMIGCVLAREPRLILADEPTNDLDVRWAGRMMELLRSRTDESRALVLVSHDPRWIPDGAIRCVMEDGVLRRNP
ncbi:MAG: ATP-binding cassette domain-containing protein [Oscillibacter sp.]|jgi:putative ABC transport system ATP-binding protein|nr:ATP-binding cassette domain-containing protein [Oscillibacter sp.]